MSAPSPGCGRITSVSAGGPADDAGVRPGDELLTINSEIVHDILDYRFLTADEQVELELRRDGRAITRSITKDAEQALGLEFEEELFDGVHTCTNHCVFCFYDQMPKGLRPSLYVRDDDFRLSFAHGNYITLTNLRDEELERICRQRLSPLYVSVHATEPDVRARMLGNRKAGTVMEQLRTLAAAGITMHAQVVLCPGVNDGAHLEQTVRDLASIHPQVASMAVVPVGLTRHRAGLPELAAADGECAARALECCSRWQSGFLRDLGTRFVFPSDELYILAEAAFPSDEEYEGYPQLEDGVGTSRLFLDELREAGERIARAAVPLGRYVLVTGVLAAPLIQGLADALGESSGTSARVCAVENRFLGESVTVAGLLAGRDIAAALADTEEDETVLIPNVALKEGVFLDDMSLLELGEAVRGKVESVPTSPLAAWEQLAGTRSRAQE